MSEIRSHKHCKEIIKRLAKQRDALRIELASCDKYAKEQYKAYENRIAELLVLPEIRMPAPPAQAKTRRLKC